MSARPLVQVFATEKAGEVVKNVALPGVFVTPIRPDVVTFVHTNIAKNKRQAYAVNKYAGHQTSAESWGTGRAVARIPRVSGGGTSRSGQAAFGNMCRGGRMFNPTKTWRRWHRKVNLNQRRYAITSALAATAVTPLVMARGHRVGQIHEIPLVLSDTVESTTKTSAAIAILKAHGAYEDVDHVVDSRQLRRGRGKMRNRRHVQRRGPLVVFANDNGLTKAFRNIPGVETVNVTRLNLLQLAPGGHLGRFVIWTQAAFAALDALYGTQRYGALKRKGYQVPRPIVTNPDISRIINSDEIQSVVRPSVKSRKFAPLKKNPLKNVGVMARLNPHDIVHRRAELRLAEKKKANKGKKVEARKGKLTEADKKGLANAVKRVKARKAAKKAQGKRLAATLAA